MKPEWQNYQLQGVNLYSVRNRNEVRVIEEMNSIISQENGEVAYSEEELYDIYAYALNRLPARYAQLGTIVLRDPVKKEMIRAVVEEAFKVIRSNPK